MKINTVNNRPVNLPSPALITDASLSSQWVASGQPVSSQNGVLQWWLYQLYKRGGIFIICLKKPLQKLNQMIDLFWIPIVM